MFKATLKQFLIGSFSVLFVSCRVHYAPNENSTPMLYEKNQFIASGSLSGGLKTTSVVFNTAYALTNHIGIGYQHSNYGKKISFDQAYDNTIHRDGYYDELLLGYFGRIKTNTIYEIYFNYGQGGNHNLYDPYLNYTGSFDGNSTIHYRKSALNLAYGVIEKNIEFSYGVKLSNVDFYSINSFGISNSVIIGELNYIKRNQNFFFVEPNATIKYGFDKLKLYNKFGFTIGPSVDKFNYEVMRFSFGIEFNYKKRK